jgi:undecaprenyl-phosphate galactose phosphotransferase
MGDVLAALAAFALSGIIAMMLSDALVETPHTPLGSDDLIRRFIQHGVIVTGLLLWFNYLGHYNRRNPFWTELKQVLTGVILAALLDGFAQYALKVQFSRLWLGLNWVMVGTLVVAIRLLIKESLVRAGVWQCPTILVGSGGTIEAARAALTAERLLGYEVVDTLDISAHSQTENARVTRLIRHVYHRHGACFVVFAADAADVPRIEPIVTELHRQRIPFAVIPSIFGMSVLGLRSDYFFSHDVVLLTSQHNLSEPLTRAVKRVFDVVLASALLLVLAPFFLMTVALIARDGGPAFFSHRRVGMHGRPFGCLKFRTMVTNADAVLKRVLESDPAAAREWARDFKLRNDPRITPIGRFLRKTSLDELPQLINVLRGEMSLVGPRPIIEAEIERYGDDIRYYLEARPGLTGLWQVSGRNDSGYARRVQLDAWYVKNWSLWHDITILLKTVRVVLSKEGAY